LKSFVKTTGGKGLHLMVPITPGVGWDEAKAFTKAIAEGMAKAAPDRYVTTLRGESNKNTGAESCELNFPALLIERCS
jgi:bifunctional non-homologous end joining protein LigD